MRASETEDAGVAFHAIEGLIGVRLSRNETVRAAHGKGEAFHVGALPDAVAWPQSTEEVAAIVRICAAHRTPIIAYGAGTSLEGGVAAPLGGLCLDLSRMDRVVRVESADLDCTVEAGVTREALNLHLRDQGLFFPIDPGANATIGGMAATRASGTNAVRYGTMRENILALTVVLADGRVVETARRARKSSAGYDMTRLFIGSEGTLGVITAVTLRLFGIPEAMAAAVVEFETLHGAVDTVIETMQMGVPVARIELLNARQIAASNAFSKTRLAERPTLFLEFHGTENEVAEQAAHVAQIAAGHGGGAFQWAREAEQRAALWKARHQAYYAAKAMRPGAEVLVTDVCVPISRLTECIMATEIDIERSGALAPIVGHVGDGNFHVLLNVDPADAEDVARAHRINDALVDRALALGGTCTGEHGIGLGKRHKLVMEHGVDLVGAMAQIKSALDPLGILNPGKIFLP